jgi:hypothetical protein
MTSKGHVRYCVQKSAARCGRIVWAAGKTQMIREGMCNNVGMSMALEESKCCVEVRVICWEEENRSEIVALHRSPLLCKHLIAYHQEVGVTIVIVTSG